MDGAACGLNNVRGGLQACSCGEIMIMSQLHDVIGTIEVATLSGCLCRKGEHLSVEKIGAVHFSVIMQGGDDYRKNEGIRSGVEVVHYTSIQVSHRASRISDLVKWNKGCWWWKAFDWVRQ